MKQKERPNSLAVQFWERAVFIPGDKDLAVFLSQGIYIPGDKDIAVCLSQGIYIPGDRKRLVFISQGIRNTNSSFFSCVHSLSQGIRNSLFPLSQGIKIYFCSFNSCFTLGLRIFFLILESRNPCQA